jgi:hypothetical protein
VISAHPERVAVEGFRSSFPLADSSGKALPLWVFAALLFAVLAAAHE